MPHGIMFHHFSDDKHRAGQGAISGDQLARLIEFIGRDRILSAEEWFTLACRDELKDDDLCLTFDDALLCQFEVAEPVLRSYSISALWFIYSSVVSGGVEMLEVYRNFRTMCFASVDDFYDSFFYAIEHSTHRDQVRLALQDYDSQTYLSEFPFYSNNDRKFRYLRDVALDNLHYNKLMDSLISSHGIDIEKLTKDLWMQKYHIKSLHDSGHIIGLHSHTHPTTMASLNPEEQEFEYVTNFEILREITGAPPKVMSHPCNSYNDVTLNILRKMDIKIGFCSNMSKPNLKELEYPREDHTNVMDAMKS